MCLSLLGTWSGEPWDPQHSNLSQLLISILAFIFTTEPLRNEPGLETSGDKAVQVRTDSGGCVCMCVYVCEWVV